MATRAELGLQPAAAGVECLPGAAEGVELHGGAVADLINRRRAALRAAHRVIADTARQCNRLTTIGRTRRIVAADRFRRQLTTAVERGVLDHRCCRLQRTLRIVDRLDEHSSPSVIALADALALASVQGDLLDHLAGGVVDGLP